MATDLSDNTTGVELCLKFSEFSIFSSDLHMHIKICVKLDCTCVNFLDKQMGVVFIVAVPGNQPHENSSKTDTLCYDFSISVWLVVSSSKQERTQSTRNECCGNQTN